LANKHRQLKALMIDIDGIYRRVRIGENRVFRRHLKDVAANVVQFPKQENVENASASGLEWE
jgi:hypothetical protein